MLTVAPRKDKIINYLKPLVFELDMEILFQFPKIEMERTN